RSGLLKERLAPEEPDALLDRPVAGAEPDADHHARQPDEGLAELPELERVLAVAEAGADHPLPAVVRPSLDAGRGREERGPPDLRADVPQVLEVQVVAGIYLVNRDRPQHRVVEVAQVFELPLLGPRRIRIG